MSHPMKALAAAVAVGALALASSTSAAPLRVLYFTKSAGYEHSVISWKNGQPSHSERILLELAPKHDLAFTFSKDGSLFSPEYLAQFDVVMFYTSGDLTNVGVDGHPAMTAAGKQALLDYVSGGKGFIALHSGSDTFHTLESGGGNPTERGTRYKVYGEKADPFIRMVGGEFINHGPQQVAKVRVVDPKFPGCAELGDSWECMEEWYSLKEFAPDQHVLLVMLTAGTDGVDYQRPDFPLAWARPHGKGRVWYNAMGHREDIWEHPNFQAMLLGGIAWAGRRVDADVSPNIKLVAPGAATLPPQRGGT